MPKKTTNQPFAIVLLVGLLGWFFIFRVISRILKRRISDDNDQLGVK